MPDEPFDTLDKETVEKEDGRYIVFYTFDDDSETDDQPEDDS